MREIIYNKDNLKDEDITDKTRKVKLLIFNKENKIILANSHNDYQFPGGTVEKDEKLVDTVNREIQEELGISLNLKDIKPFIVPKGYYKDWPEKNRNKLVEINYFKVNTLEKPNKDKTKLTENEKNGNFHIEYIDFSMIEEVLNDNINKYHDPKGIAHEMLNIIKIYKEENMELVDLYNKQKELLDKKVDKRDVPEGLFRLSAHVWIVNDKGEILMQQRLSSAHKFPNMWSVTGGAVKAGESSLEGIQREIKEELGIDTKKDELSLIASYMRKFDFVDVWLLHKNIDLKDIKMQKEEVQDVKWFKLDEYEKMIEDKKAIRSSFDYYNLYIHPRL